MLAALNPFDHVLDSFEWHLFHNLHMHVHLPFGLTKYKILMLLAAGLILAIFIPLARRASSGEPPSGVFWNAFEGILSFIRDKVAKPYIGHDADRYVPFLWTLFLFILFCNLLGMIPFMGSPTASISVTGALALIAFFAIHGSAVAEMGPAHYLKSYVPHIDVPFGMGYILIPMIVVIEVIGNFIKAFVLAVRLFANMFAGHTVLAVILLFIVMVKDQSWFLFWPITVASVVGVTALSLLELFVAFLQAFIFAFLTALFLGSALHPQH
ncbi:MAG: F0F1 ATP synthase subunit A [Planctomycetes bacterium]|nr:F0F1 ATP synthase subunit A [Planctomycetota bacterium]